MKMSIPNVVGRFISYHAKDNAWGSLHIVLSDGNVKNSNVEFCIREAHDKGDVEGEALARILLDMSKTQRCKIAVIACGLK
jgi:hypothetical protein